MNTTRIEEAHLHLETAFLELSIILGRAKCRDSRPRLHSRTHERSHIAAAHHRASCPFDPQPHRGSCAAQRAEAFLLTIAKMNLKPKPDNCTCTAWNMGHSLGCPAMNTHEQPNTEVSRFVAQNREALAPHFYPRDLINAVWPDCPKDTPMQEIIAKAHAHRAYLIQSLANEDIH